MMILPVSELIREIEDSSITNEMLVETLLQILLFNTAAYISREYDGRD